MGVVEQLASSLGRKDETPNLALASKLAADKDIKNIAELAGVLQAKGPKPLRHDAVKVLYETGALAPALIAPYHDLFVRLLTDSDNRLQWGAMTALRVITAEKPQETYLALPQIMEAARNGSVITRDQAVSLLVVLGKQAAYTEESSLLLNELLLTSPANQVPMYAEQLPEVAGPGSRDMFIASLTGRLGDMEKESRKKRLETVIKKLQRIPR